ncbi:hypothetical protein K1719_028190 [Acacia pycnantha]|nr:hypothetical protein K1719_028190 [Acacia pycnantha]
MLCTQKLFLSLPIFSIQSLDGYEYGDESFEQIYRCYPASSLNKPHLENGDKIIMPPLALNFLAFLNIDYPMMFEIRNDAAGRVSHCGVLEFTAEEGMVYMPNWMMGHMLLQEGENVEIKNVRLPKGTFIKLQPHTKDFLDVSNPKAILETTLRNCSCLTIGDTIMVTYNKKKYYINIIDTKPSNGVSIIDTDFEEPPTEVESEPKFSPFSGAARRLDGRPVNNEPSPPSSSSSGSKDRRSSVQNENGNDNTHSCAASSSQSNSHASQGKLVFGSNGNQTAKGKELKQETSPQKQEPKFQPFSGKKYSLLG